MNIICNAMYYVCICIIIDTYYVWFYNWVAFYFIFVYIFWYAVKNKLKQSRGAVVLTL